RLYSLWVGTQRGSARGYHMLYAGSARRARTLNLEEALESLEADLRHAVALFSRDRVFVHAGVVGWQGRAILVPGPRQRGQTPLVHAPGRAGAESSPDEYAVLDDRGRVHPFAKPLSIREGAALRRCTAEELGGVSGHVPLRVGAIVVTSYRAGAHWRPV